jgi:hypothetical protein
MSLMSSRRGAAESMTLPLMVLSFVLIGGFMYWLSVTAEPTKVLMEEDAPIDAALADDAVTWAAFAADPTSFAGQTISVPGVPVASLLGIGAFWSQFPNETPYLVKLTPALLADSLSVATGDVGDLRGTVHMMTDSVLNAWQEAGVFTNDVQRIEAEFATSFLEAEGFEVRGPAGG